MHTSISQNIFQAFSHTFCTVKSMQKALSTASSPTDFQRRTNKSLKTENSLRSDSSVFLTRFIHSFLALQVLRNYLTCRFIGRREKWKLTFRSVILSASAHLDSICIPKLEFWNENISQLSLVSIASFLPSGNVSYKADISFGCVSIT